MSSILHKFYNRFGESKLLTINHQQLNIRIYENSKVHYLLPIWSNVY